MNIFNDPMALQQMQQMGINPYQFQAFLQSPQGQQVAQECNQYTMSKFGEYVQSINQNFNQQGNMGKSNATEEVDNKLAQENEELKAQLEQNNKDIAFIKEALLNNNSNTKKKGETNGTK